MYTEHFKLKETPFSIAPNPQYLFMSRRHRDALAHLLYGVQSDGGFILLTGEVGTGKTTLCRCLLEQIPTDVETAFVLNPLVTANELLATICDEFGIPYEVGAATKTMVDELNRYLLSCHAIRKKTVLLIDEAQNLKPELLEQLRLLTNLETNERKLLQIILLGQPELLETLAQKNLRQFSQRITARFQLEPLDQQETSDYVEHRLSVAGSDEPIFERSAINRIFKLSTGIPRVINLICDRSLLGAYAEGRSEVSAKIVNRAAEEVLGRQIVQNYRKPFALAAATATLALTVFAYQQLSVEHKPTPEIVVEAIDDVLPIILPNSPSMPAVSGYIDIKLAYHDLFTLWGTAFEDKVSHPCELAETIGLLCHQRQVDLQELTRMNRPVVVRIENNYLTLSQISGDLVSLIAGENQYELTSEQFRKLFDGEINMLWRAPPAYNSPLRVNDTGAAVDWLVVQLSVIEGATPPLEAGFIYNAQLVARVKDFQSSVGLYPNGIVDTLTWIHINNVEAISIPTLAENKRG